MTGVDFLTLAAQFGLLSLLSIGGVSAILADSQRILVVQHGWLTEAQFAHGVAIGQAAPGPNILVVAVLGWMAAGPLGLLACLGGVLLPSTLLVWRFSAWARRNPKHRGLQAFQAGSAPLVLGLTLSGCVVLAQPYMPHSSAWAWVLLVLVAVGSAKTRLAPVLWLALGAVAGAAGWV
jgi:chromate transporter